MGDTAGFRLGFVNGVEQAQGLQLAWTGRPLPEWMAGAVLVRNGPGLFQLDQQRMNHWFDGLAMLTRIQFGRDTVDYRSAFLRSNDHAVSTGAGRARFTEFGTAPDRSIRQRLGLLVRPSALFGDNASVNVIPVNGEWWALWDVPKSMRLDGATLATIGSRRERFDPRVGLRTPHPVWDEAAGEWINVGLGFTARGPAYTVLASSEPDMEMRRLVSVPSWTPAYLHSFAMSRRYVVITEHSFGPTPAGGLALLFGSRPLVDACRWRKRHRTRLLVVDRTRGGVVRRIEIDPVVILHHINAFESDDGMLNVDVCAFTDRDVLDRLFFRRLEAPNGGDLARSTVQRYRIDLEAGSVSVDRLTDRPLEMPWYDRRRTGVPYRYLYGQSMHRPDDFNDELLKIDLDTGAVRAFYAAGTYPGEPVFVARPGAVDEDDGVVLSVVLDSNEACSFVVALDAATFTEIGRARLPHVVPHGLHGFVTLPDGKAAR